MLGAGTGRVVAVNVTADDTRLAAQLSRPKEKPQVFFVTELASLHFPDLLAEVTRALPGEARVWLVGGALRDALLNRRIHDLDFAVAGDALKVARAVADALGAAFFPLDSERAVGRVIVTRAEERFILDFAALRGPDLPADLAARDFTLNAIALDLADPDNLIDPLNGESDLRIKVIRACSATALADDPLRGVRAVRLAAQLDFRIDKETRTAIRAQAGALAQVSFERRRDEFIRCVGGPRPAAALRALEMLGLLPHLLPELAPLTGVTQSPPHTLDVWEHTLGVVERLNAVLAILAPVHDVDAASELTLGLVSVQLGRHRLALHQHLQAMLSGERPARWLLMLAALLHDVGKPGTRSVESNGRIRFLNHENTGAEIVGRRLTRLHFSGDEVKRAKTIVAHHMRPRQLSSTGETVSRRAIYRFFRATGEAGVDIVLLSLADLLAKDTASPPPQDEWAYHLSICAQLLNAYFEKPEETVAPPALITGHDLIAEFALEAGPRVGQLLEAVREAQAAGEITDRAAALDFIRQQLANK